MHKVFKRLSAVSPEMFLYTLLGSACIAGVAIVLAIAFGGSKLDWLALYFFLPLSFFAFAIFFAMAMVMMIAYFVGTPYVIVRGRLWKGDAPLSKLTRVGLALSYVLMVLLLYAGITSEHNSYLFR